MLAKPILSELQGIVGRDRCLTAPEDLLVYSHDTYSGKKPDVVLLPAATEEVSKILRLANREGIPVTPRASATGLTGMCVPEHGGIVMAMSKMNRILEVNPEDRLAVVEPGVITNDLQMAAEAAGVFYPPDPSSLAICQIGGNVATNAGGPRCVKYGVTRDYLLGLEAVLPSGEMIKSGGRPIKNVTGYDITRLLCGSEGTLAVITKIIVKLIAKPEARRTLLVAFRSIEDASTTVSRIMAAGIIPRALELMDQHYIQLCDKMYHLGHIVDIGNDILMRQHDSFGLARRAGCIENRGCVRHLSLRHGPSIHGALSNHILKRHSPRTRFDIVHADQMLQAGEVVDSLLEFRQEASGDYQRLAAGIAKYEAPGWYLE